MRAILDREPRVRALAPTSSPSFDRAVSWSNDRHVFLRKLPGLPVALAVVLVRTLSAQAPAATPQGPDPPLPTIRETVVVTGSASPVTFETLGRTVRVLTREELARLPARDVADVLRLVSSVSVRSRGAWGVQTEFSIRGATFGQTLVLVDGIRLNDTQTGHHNGDIPVPLDEIERVEVLLGPGSALFGADAFGGTINIITRRGVGAAQAQLRAGRFGTAVASASGGFERGALRQSAAVAFDRSDGFMAARDHRILTLRSQTMVGDSTALAVAFTDKDFGANGFYGPSPSYEWTSQTLVSAEHRFLDDARIDVSGRAFYRTHGDLALAVLVRHDEVPGPRLAVRNGQRVAGPARGVHPTREEQAHDGDTTLWTGLGDRGLMRNGLETSIRRRLARRSLRQPSRTGRL